ncbi:MAG: septum formation initiator family protein [Acidobacteria bacterium]|nr:septum formation initiator family protein [Acidobacteriota bacterium]MBI3663642.1 septum formation initiator family protein [Acidobacteriota bacterium]
MGVRIKRAAHTARPAARKSGPKRAFLQRWGGTIFVLLLMALVAHVLFGEHGFLAMRRAQKEVDKLRQEIAQLSDENKKLSGEIQALKTDPQLIERIARDEMGLARQGELIFKLPQKKSTDK